MNNNMRSFYDNFVDDWRRKMHMKFHLLLLSLLFLLPAISLGQTMPFPGLKSIDITPPNYPLIGAPFRIIVWFDPNISSVINKEVVDGYPRLRVLRTRINRHKNENFFIDFHEGPSLDPTFIICPEQGVQWVREFGGTTLIIPGDGFLYVSGHSNNYFNKRKKFVLKGKELIEIKQPFYYVGIESRALKDLTITSKKQGGEIVAHIPKGERVEVILNEGDYFLLKTQIGLTGWARVENIGQKAEVLEGIFFLGD
jgi:hypothetical protein